MIERLIDLERPYGGAAHSKLSEKITRLREERATLRPIGRSRKGLARTRGWIGRELSGSNDKSVGHIPLFTLSRTLGCFYGAR